MSNTQKVLRCLMLTTSQNDHEALLAIRKANQILAVLNLSWEQYLGVAIREDREPDPPPRDPEPETVPKKRMNQYERSMMMIKEVKDHLLETGSSAIEFIESLEAGLYKYGSLTERQMVALKKFYKNTPSQRSPF